MKLNFPKQVFSVVLIFVLFGSYPLMRFADWETVKAVTAGLLLSVVNVMMGYAAIEYSFDKSYTHFIQIVMGGIGIRLLVMVGILLLLVGIFKFRVGALIGTIFGMYIVFLVLEVLYIHNKWQKKIDIKEISEK